MLGSYPYEREGAPILQDLQRMFRADRFERATLVKAVHLAELRAAVRNW